MASSRDYYTDYDDSSPYDPQQPTLNNKIMVAAIVALFCFIFFISSLHICGKWLWRSRTRISDRQHQAPSTAARRTARGLSDAAIALLPTFIYTNQSKNASSALECAVCLSEFHESEEGRMLPACKHSFHIECIDMWFYSHSTCPLCRAVVLPINTPSSCNIPSALPTYEQHETRQEEVEAAHDIRITIDSTTSTPSFTLEDNNMPAATLAMLNNHTSSNAMESLPSSQVDPTHFTTDKPSSSSIKHTTRSVPQITIEIPARHDIRLTSPGCISLPSRRLSRCRVPPHDQSCSSETSVKSPGIHVSLKRILSMKSGKEKSLFVESPKDTEATLVSSQAYR